MLLRYFEYSSTRDFVLVSSFTDNDDSLHWAGKICSTLNVPAIFMGDVSHNRIYGLAKTAFESHGAECLGVIVSGVEDAEAEQEYLRQHDLKPLALIPHSRTFERRSINEVLAILDDGVVLGK